MGLRALERRLVLMRAWLAVGDEVDRYLDLSKQRGRLLNPVALTAAIMERGLDPSGIIKGRDHLLDCIRDGVMPDRDDLVCRILGIDHWLAWSIEASKPPWLQNS
jgi:hypothetical protein